MNLTAYALGCIPNGRTESFRWIFTRSKLVFNKDKTRLGTDQLLSIIITFKLISITIRSSCERFTKLILSRVWKPLLQCIEVNAFFAFLITATNCYYRIIRSTVYYMNRCNLLKDQLKRKWYIYICIPVYIFEIYRIS